MTDKKTKKKVKQQEGDVEENAQGGCSGSPWAAEAEGFVRNLTPERAFGLVLVLWFAYFALDLLCDSVPALGAATGLGVRMPSEASAAARRAPGGGGEVAAEAEATRVIEVPRHVEHYGSFGVPALMNHEEANYEDRVGHLNPESRAEQRDWRTPETVHAEHVMDSEMAEYDAGMARATGRPTTTHLIDAARVEEMAAVHAAATSRTLYHGSKADRGATDRINQALASKACKAPRFLSKAANWRKLYINRDLKIAYMPVLKNAHVNIKYRLGVTHSETMLEPDAGGCTLAKLKAQGITVFTFVRDPASRARSAFAEMLASPAQDRQLGLNRPCDQHPEWCLDTVLAGIQSTKYRDEHFDLQTMFIGGGKPCSGKNSAMPFDFIGRVEEFEADWERLLAVAGAPAELVRKSEVDVPQKERFGSQAYQDSHYGKVNWDQQVMTDGHHGKYDGRHNQLADMPLTRHQLDMISKMYEADYKCLGIYGSGPMQWSGMSGDGSGYSTVDVQSFLDKRPGLGQYTRFQGK